MRNVHHNTNSNILEIYVQYTTNHAEFNANSGPIAPGQ